MIIHTSIIDTRIYIKLLGLVFSSRIFFLMLGLRLGGSIGSLIVRILQKLLRQGKTLEVLIVQGCLLLGSFHL